MSWKFQIEFLSSGGFFVYELIILTESHFSCGFLVPKLEIPGGMNILQVDSSSMIL
jgi:hypothetical protein